MLSTQGIGCPDDALGPYPLADRPHQARLLDECLCLGLADREAWAMIVGDAATKVVRDGKGRERIVLAGPLDHARAVYGSRLRRTGQKPRRASRPRKDVPTPPAGGCGPETATQGRLL